MFRAAASWLARQSQRTRGARRWTTRALLLGGGGSVVVATAAITALQSSCDAATSRSCSGSHAVDTARAVLPQSPLWRTETSSCEQSRHATNEHDSASSDESSSTGETFILKEVYEVQDVLGQGAYGMVYKARRKLDGLQVALKAMPREYTGKTDFEREVAALQLLSKPPHGPNQHVVQLYDLHRDENNYYLAMELIEGGELFEHLIENGPYSEKVAANFLRQFAEAVCFVHNTGLTHADLKPENLMMEADKMSLKLVDFGCTCTHDMGRKELQLPANEFAIGCSVLHQAALGNQFEISRLLLERPELVNFRDYDKRTPLHVAASEGHLDLCRYLVERGAIINRVDRWGGTPMDDAHRHGHNAVLRFLGHRGGTFASTSSKDQTVRLITAASQGDTDEVKALLEFGDVDVNKGDYDKRTALHLAAGEGRLSAVKVLLDSGADPNVEDRWGNRPLDDAKQAKQNSASMISLLKQHGATSGVAKALRWTTKSKKNDSSSDVPNLEETNITGTVAYWAPELFEAGAKPTPAADMWAVGVIVYILLTGTHPIDKYANKSDDQVAFILSELGRRSRMKDENGVQEHLALMDQLIFDERTEDLSDSCVTLMKDLMHLDPEKRMTSEDFRRHPWIQGLTASWDLLEKTHSELEGFWQNRFRMEIIKKFGAIVNTTPKNGQPLSEKNLRTMFDALDLKKNGVLELEEIITTFQELGVSEKNTRQIFSFADLDGSGVIRWDEFRALMHNDGNREKSSGLQVQYLQERFRGHILNKFGIKGNASPDARQLRSIFDDIDLEGNGFLDPHELRVLLRSVGEPEETISKIMASLDLSRQGGLSWPAFQRIMGLSNVNA